MFVGSWRTTMAAMVLALSAVLTAASQLMDSDPATNPNWETVMAEVAAAWGFWHARDNAVTSEQAGAK